MNLTGKDNNETKINSLEELNEAIKRNEKELDAQEEGLREQFRVFTEKMQLKNIVGNALKEVGESVSLRKNLLKVAAGLGAGYISKRLLPVSSSGTAGKIFGRALEFGVAALVAGKAARKLKDGRIGKIGSFIGKLFKKGNQ